MHSILHDKSKIGTFGPSSVLLKDLIRNLAWKFVFFDRSQNDKICL
jgi:hypothetical protein